MCEEIIRVLIVDDLPQVREGLAALIRLAGSAAHPRIVITGEAEDGREALRQVEVLHPDVILMDLEMPVMDGYAATRCIKIAHPAIWIIALTIHGGSEARRKAAAAGVDVFLEKGAALAELLQAIRSRPADDPMRSPNNTGQG